VDETVPFVALSYVWGGAPQIQLTQTTHTLLMRDGGLDEVLPALPTTIRDAILVCEILGVRTLFTGCVCIMQD
jgi:hypothetical protein